MQRRTLLKQLVYVTGGVCLLPSCMQDTSKSSILLKKIIINNDEEKLMASLAEAIIPATDTPGAKDISAHLFALMMVDDCYETADQQKFVSGLKAFTAYAEKKYNKAFINCTPSEKGNLLTELEAKRPGNEQLDYFYSHTKKLTIQAYITSQFYLTKVQVYKLIPGHFYGCVPVKQSS